MIGSATAASSRMAHCLSRVPICSLSNLWVVLEISIAETWPARWVQSQKDSQQVKSQRIRMLLVVYLPVNPDDSEHYGT
jgi:hypothetical protein